MELGTVVFYAVAALVVLSAAMVAFSRNIIYSAFSLLGTFAGVAGIYVFLGADFVAGVQLLIYVGGILVLILFATLFSADVMGIVQRTPLWLRALGFLGTALAAAAGVRLVQVAMQSAARLDHARSAPGTVDPIGGDHSIGDLLAGAWSVPFLAAGALLTVALVGAVATVKRFRRPAGGTGA